MMPERLVIDASALVDLLAATSRGSAVADRVSNADLHAPAHLDAEVLSALGRLHRDRRITARQVGTRLAWLTHAPIERHPLAPLVEGAWRRRHRLRLVDALYAELADRLQATLVTTDDRLAGALPGIEVIAPGP